MIVYQGDINFGYVLDENRNVSRPQYQSTYVALANNSIVVVENQFGTFNNPILASTSPIIGSQVNEFTKQFQFTFTYPMNQIYQQTNESNYLLRQRFQVKSDEDLDKNLWTLIIECKWPNNWFHRLTLDDNRLTAADDLERYVSWFFTNIGSFDIKIPQIWQIYC
ncbi:hypothetical protein F8M41_002209 [Gigaspora margarita]|uniref:Uncharacterized protein n=1 Tax=Gigaspora margarita TaxID=4874 RepID=A0A8H4A8M3_GIGMA|nr:hypothetical protein F8M41_002209 [Gigaspora margarita]